MHQYILVALGAFGLLACSSSDEDTGSHSNKDFDLPPLVDTSGIFEKAQKEDKLVLVMSSAEWCLPCKEMKADVLSDKEIKSLIEDHFLFTILMHEPNLEMTWKGETVGMDNFLNRHRMMTFPSFSFFNVKGEYVNPEIVSSYIEKEIFAKTLNWFIKRKADNTLHPQPL